MGAEWIPVPLLAYMPCAPSRNTQTVKVCKRLPVALVNSGKQKDDFSFSQ